MIEKIISMNEKVQEGYVEALPTYVELHKLSKAIKEAMDEIKDQAIDEATTRGKGEHQEFGVTFQVKAAGGRYSYKHLPWFLASKEREKLAQTAYKQAEKGLKTITEDGEIVEPAEYTHGRDTISIKI